MSRMVAVACSCLLVIWGCSKSSSPTSDGGDTTPPATVQEVIGSDGGTIENSGMKVTIPEGMLSEDSEIVLAEAVETSFGEDALTPTYTVDGIPESTTGTMTLKLKYDGEAPDALTLALGEMASDLISGESDVLYHLYPATITDGWIVTDIAFIEILETEPEGGTKAATPKIAAQIGEKFYVKGLKGYQENLSSSKIFSIKNQVFWEDAAETLGLYCDAIFIYFRNMGMPMGSVDGNDRLITPVNIECKDLGAGNSGRMYDDEPRASQNNDIRYHRFRLTFNELRLGLSEDKIKEMRYEAGMQIFDMFAYLGNPDAYKSKPENRWAYNAMKEWAAAKAAEDTTCYSYHAAGHPEEALRGLHDGLNAQGQDRTDYGRGMTALIKYLDDTNGADGSVVISMLKDFMYGKHSAEALLDGMSGSTNEWWPRFTKAFLAGEVYPIDTDELFNSPAGSWTINASAQPTKQFSDSYGDLSAKIYKINLEHTTGDPDQSIRLSTDGQVNPDFLTIMLYKKDSQGNPVQIMQGSELSISSMKAFMDEHTDELYAIVVNSACEAPYTEQSTVTFNITTEEKSEHPDAPIVDPNLIFVTIPAGSFDMGYAGGTITSPVHRVRLDSFEMTTTEITNYQFACFLNAALATGDIIVVPFEEDGKTIHVPFTVTSSGSKEDIIIKLYHSFTHEQINAIVYNPSTFFTVEGGKGSHPVSYVSWEGAVAFAEYYNCRLPTEAEWEYACRAGTTTMFYTGDDMDEDLSDAAWGWDNTLEDGKRYTQMVGQKTPNDWGLYDMHGNVQEWCHDIYSSSYYDESPEYNPTGPESGSSHVQRGGSINGVGASSSRGFSNGPEEYIDGFRIASDL